MLTSDTIFALSTAPGRAGVAIVRISGPAAGAALRTLTTADSLPEPRRATLAHIGDAAGRAIDRGLVLWFPGPASFTGEDMAELHLHGGHAVVALALDALAAQPSLRLAEPGDFTRRAFDNGKLDLTEVEGLSDLIAAETAAQQRQALRQMDGALFAVTEAWRNNLLAALAGLEAVIDFPDEEIPDDLSQEVRESLAPLADDIASHLADEARGERLRDGYRIAIIGPTNAGKSSLLNALAKRDVAIVSSQAGTTRDVIEVHLDLAGYPVILADTAGLRALNGPSGADEGAEIEREGMRRTRERAGKADLKLAVFDTQTWPDLDGETRALIDEHTFVLLNKSDLAPDSAEARALAGAPCFPVSAMTGEGLDSLIDRLEARVTGEMGGSDSAPVVTRLRHRQALNDCFEALRRAMDADAVELAAEDLRLAVRALGRIAGRVDVEDVLDVIFAEFCLGK